MSAAFWFDQTARKTMKHRNASKQAQNPQKPTWTLCFSPTSGLSLVLGGLPISHHPIAQRTANQQALSIASIRPRKEPKPAKNPGCGCECSRVQTYIPGLIGNWYCNASPSVMTANATAATTARAMKAVLAIIERISSDGDPRNISERNAHSHQVGVNNLPPVRFQMQTPL